MVRAKFVKCLPTFKEEDLGKIVFDSTSVYLGSIDRWYRIGGEKYVSDETIDLNNIDAKNVPMETTSMLGMLAYDKCFPANIDNVESSIQYIGNILYYIRNGQYIAKSSV